MFTRSKPGDAPGNLKRYELRHTMPAGDETAQGEWLIEDIRAGPFGLGVTDSALRVRHRRRRGDGSMAETVLRFNFPMNTVLRDTFVAGLTEVLAAHAFCAKRLRQPDGTLPPAVNIALHGAIVRQRAARALGSHGGGNRCKLPFSVASSEPTDSLLPLQLAELLTLADEREGRAAEAVAGRAAEAVAAAFDLERDTSEHSGRSSLSRQNSLDSVGVGIRHLREAPVVRDAAVIRDTSVGSAAGVGGHGSAEPVPKPSVPKTSVVSAETGAPEPPDTATETAGKRTSTQHPSRLPSVNAADVAGAEPSVTRPASHTHSRPPSTNTGEAAQAGAVTPHAGAVAEAAEKGVAERIAATAAARRELARGTERAQASFAALPGEEERRLRRIKHNMRLIRALVTGPLEQAFISAETLLSWQSPGLTGVTFALLQALVLFDWLRFIPALLLVSSAAQVMEVQRRRKAEGAPVYSIEYHYPLTKGVLNRARRVDRMIARADSVVQTILITLLKTHSAFASVDSTLSLRFAAGLGGLGFLCALGAILFGFLPSWLFLSPAITLGFSVRHPLLALVLGHQVDASSAVAAALWSGAAIVPLLCIAPLERVVITAGGCAVVLGCLRYKHTRDHEGEHAQAGRFSELLSRRVEVQRQVREWWELLPAPSVRNTADTDVVEDMPR